eukprot:9666626-Ditylum_brightwellii.AAC.1
MEMSQQQQQKKIMSLQHFPSLRWGDGAIDVVNQATNHHNLTRRTPLQEDWAIKKSQSLQQHEGSSDVSSVTDSGGSQQTQTQQLQQPEQHVGWDGLHYQLT